MRLLGLQSHRSPTIDFSAPTHRLPISIRLLSSHSSEVDAACYMSLNRTETMDDLSSDDYVARVLAREARDNSANYARQGAEAYLPRRYDRSQIYTL